MKIYPAIDIKSGKCVRLYKGSYDLVTVYEENPITMALEFKKQGAEYLHIVDLDGAKLGQSVNLDLILDIKKQSELIIQTGGGIRDLEQATQLLNAGIDRIIVGSLAVSNPTEIKRWLSEFGPDRIVLALDVRQEMLAVHGWQTDSQVTLWSLLEEYSTAGLKHVLCTDIDQDGTLEGPNFELYKKGRDKFPDILFQASGGVSSLEDLQKLSVIPVSGVIIGKALYENKFSLREALNVS